MNTEDEGLFCPYCVKFVSEQECSGIDERGQIHECGNYVFKRSRMEPLSEVESFDKMFREQVSGWKDLLSGKQKDGEVEAINRFVDLTLEILSDESFAAIESLTTDYRGYLSTSEVLGGNDVQKGLVVSVRLTVKRLLELKVRLQKWKEVLGDERTKTERSTFSIEDLRKTPTCIVCGQIYDNPKATAMFRCGNCGNVESVLDYRRRMK